MFDSSNNYILGKPHVLFNRLHMQTELFSFGGDAYYLYLNNSGVAIAEGDPSQNNPLGALIHTGLNNNFNVGTVKPSEVFADWVWDRYCLAGTDGLYGMVKYDHQDPDNKHLLLLIGGEIPFRQGTLSFNMTLQSDGNEFDADMIQPYVKLVDKAEVSPVDLYPYSTAGDSLTNYQWFENFEDPSTEIFLGEGYHLDDMKFSAGTHEITVVVYNAHGLYSTDTMTLTVSNSPPIANDDSYRADEDSTIVGNVLSDDTDANGDVLRAIKLTDTSHGTLSFSPNGNFTYVPDPNWSGTDSFTYKAVDDSGGSDTATVNIMILPVNDPPVAINDAYDVDQCTVIRIRTDNGVLINDGDVEGDPLTAKKLTDPPNGTLAWDPSEDGSFSYAPSGNYYGTDSFTYVANDGELDSNVAAVSITVNKLSPDKQMEYCLESTVLASPDLDEGIKRSLLMKLDMAIQKYQTRGQIPVACKLLQAFINEVTSLISDGVMPRDDGYELIDFANDILADINC